MPIGEVQSVSEKFSERQTHTQHLRSREAEFWRRPNHMEAKLGPTSAQGLTKLTTERRGAHNSQGASKSGWPKNYRILDYIGQVTYWGDLNDF